MLMIWSLPIAKLRENQALLHSSHTLMATTLLEEDFEDRRILHEPVEYLTIPPMLHKIGKLVIPYVLLDGRGMLDTAAPAFYAVTNRPDDASLSKRSVSRRSQEAHVIAEDLALRHGIFTPYARANAEVLVSGMLPDVYRESYMRDRIAHIGALVDEASKSEYLSEKHREVVIDELQIATEALSNRLS